MAVGVLNFVSQSPISCFGLSVESLFVTSFSGAGASGAAPFPLLAAW